MTRFMRDINARFGKNFSTYDQLHEWSIENREDLWLAMWDFGGVIASKKGETILLDGDKMPGSIWFPGASLNFAENLLKFRDNRIAMIFRGEDGGGYLSRMLNYIFVSRNLRWRCAATA